LTGKVLIIGDGPCAINTAKELSTNGIETVLASRKEIVQTNPDGINQGNDAVIKVHNGVEISTCHGCVNDFKVAIRSGGQEFSENVSGIVIAEEYHRKENFEIYGLKPSSSVCSLSAITSATQKNKKHEIFSKKGCKVLFFTGCFEESNPVVLEEVMACALELQKEYHQEVFILTGNLKVAGDGLEALYRKTKDAGVFYIKVDHTPPEIEQSDDGSVAVVYKDEILQSVMKLSPDFVVVDETLLPSDYLEVLAGVFELDQDETGYLQSDNVHRDPVFTNRRGILVAGPTRAIQDRQAQLDDAGSAAIAQMHLISGKTDLAIGRKAVIGVVECARCITCFRICPYKAIRLENRVTVYADACEGCGICVAECPREYITLTGPGISDELKKIHINGVSESRDSFIPTIVAFCCARSAGKSFRMALDLDKNIAQYLKIVEVPCAGGISTDHILRTFLKAADGVMILTCHQGNCHSEVGNQYAKERTENVADRLAVMGFEKERLRLETIAANMGGEFLRIVTEFRNQLQEIGPSKIRKNLKN
jgi:quinone-modifying oxidoreductase subunit QmoB